MRQARVRPQRRSRTIICPTPVFSATELIIVTARLRLFAAQLALVALAMLGFGVAGAPVLAAQAGAAGTVSETLAVETADAPVDASHDCRGPAPDDQGPCGPTDSRGAPMPPCPLGLAAGGACATVVALPAAVPAPLVLPLDRVPPTDDAELRSRLAAVEFFRPPRAS